MTEDLEKIAEQNKLLKEAIEVWKKLNIAKCELTFDCGGDSMGNTEFAFTNEADEEVESEELTAYFDEAIYKNVEFYVNSDGHYQGEAGTVEITLNEDGDDFTYDKNSEKEYSESWTSTMEVELEPEMVKFIKENVSNINGSEGDDITINYKKDVILSDADEELIKKLNDVIVEATSTFSPDDLDETVDDWYTFTTNSEDLPSLTNLTIEDNKLKISINNSYTLFRDE